MKQLLQNFQEKIKEYADTVVQDVVRRNTLLLPEIADLEKIQKAHHTLLKKYISVVTGVDRQPFFMPDSVITGIPRHSFWRNLFLIVSRYNPLRLINLRPFIVFAIEFHIHKKLKELEVGYTQFAYLIPADQDKRKSYIKWLKVAKSECVELRETLSSGKMIIQGIRTIGLSFGGFLVAMYGVNNLYQLILKIFLLDMSQKEWIWMGGIVIFLIMFLGYSTIFIENTFRKKRTFFLKSQIDQDQPSIYQFENELFSLLNRRKPIEFAIDYFFGTLKGLIFLGIFWLLAIQIDKMSDVKSPPPSSYSLNCLWVFVAIVALYTIIEFVIPWIKRIQSEEI